MPRAPRVVLPGFPHHIVQRGHNRRAIFLREMDFRVYLAALAEWKTELRCKVYAYCLMTNHVHLVVDPAERSENLALLMKRLAGRYTRYRNCIEKRSGTAWNGRYKSSPIDTDAYLMACCRYVELNPVRAFLVAEPQHYRWSSFRARVGLRRCEWLDQDPCYAALGDTPDQRAARYRRFVAAAIPQGEWELIRAAVRRGQLSGRAKFEAFVERQTGRRIESRGPGRPKT